MIATEQLQSYVSTLRPGDQVVFRTPHTQHVNAVFVRQGDRGTIIVRPVVLPLVGGKVSLPVQLENLMRACRACGCTDDRACSGGCAWADPKTCTRCVYTPRTARRGAA